MSESIPQVLQYGVSQSMFRTNEFACFPQEGSQSANGRYTVKLPSKSIVDLSSLRAVWDLAISVTADATNFTNASCPAAWQLFRSIQFVVGGSSVSGHQSQHYNQIYHALAKATGNIEWVNNHLNEGAAIMRGSAQGEFDNTDVGNTVNPTIASKSVRLSMNDFLGLPRGNGGELYLDTSLFGDVTVIFEIDNTSCLHLFQGGTGNVNTVNFTLSNFVVNVKCVTSVSPLYVELLAMKLKSKTPIRIPFENMISTLQNNGTTARLSVNTSCLDKLLILPTVDDPNGIAAIADAPNTLSNVKFRYNSGRTKSNSNQATLQVRIGSEYYPKQQIKNLMDIAAITEDTISGSAADRQNLLFAGLSGGSITYSRNNFLSNNCIFYQKYCLQEGWAQGKNLTGISSNGSQLDIVAEYSNFGTYQLMCAFVTSQLIYDPESGTVSVEN